MANSVFHQWLEDERRDKCVVRFRVCFHGRSQGVAKPDALDVQILLYKYELFANGDLR